MENMPMQLATAGRSEFTGVRKGAWTPEEDLLLKKCIDKYGERQWHLVPTRAGLRRCRKSCRQRWLNYLKPNIKRGPFDEGEVDLIIRLHRLVGNRWTFIASRIPGRTANDVKNFWNSHLGKMVNPNRQGVVDNEETAGSTTVVEPNPASASSEKSYPTGTPSGALSFVVKPQAVIPPETAFLWAPMSETCHETSYEPSATDREAANEEDLLSWVRNLLLGDEGEDEEEQQQQLLQWGQENMVPFRSGSQAGDQSFLTRGLGQRRY